MDGPCASSCGFQTLRTPRGSKTIGIKKQAVCLPCRHHGALGLWPPQLWRCRGGAVWCLLYITLLAALLSLTSASSEPQTLLSDKINLMPLGMILRLPWCSCVLVAAATSCPLLGVWEEQLFLDSQLPCPSGAAWVQVAGSFFCRNSLGVCQGQKTKPGRFCNCPVWHLLSSDPHGVRDGART